MQWAKAVLAVGTAVVILAGCSESPSEPTPVDGAVTRPSLSTTTLTRAADDAELDQLVQRVVALKGQVATAGRITLSHQLELDRLATAVTAWRSRTGRTDINVSSPQPLQRQSVPTGDTPTGCSACPVISADSPGKICFLKGIGGCVPVGDELWPVCYYLCFDIATGVPDIRRR